MEISVFLIVYWKCFRLPILARLSIRASKLSTQSSHLELIVKFFSILDDSVYRFNILTMAFFYWGHVGPECKRWWYLK